ncbi:MAG TPA: putative lipid II flippase FtsW [Acidimicrobiales bacterium]|nr:putative lipid II flippase FtsW [Acidimicrobiales bacterium]
MKTTTRVPGAADGATPPVAGGRFGAGGPVVLVTIVATLCVVGLVMVLSASSVQALRDQGSSWSYFLRQLLWVAVGGTAMMLAARVDYRRWRRLGLPLLVLSAALLVAVLVPGVGIQAGGSTRWLGIGGWRVQPSELAKLALLLFSADLLSRLQGPGRVRSAMWGAVTGFGLLAALVMLQPDMGTTLILGAVTMAVLFAGAVPLPTMAGLVAASVAGAVAAGYAEPYRRARLLSFRNPWADPDNTGYQVVQSLVGMGTGRVTGVGVGASRAKWGFLPNAHTDFIFAIIGEELGLIGSLAVLALFAGLTVLGVRTALRAPDLFGVLLAAGVTAWIASQAVVNIGAVTGMLPVTGVPLPFVSFGGSSLVILMVAVGILANVAAQGGRAARAAR